MSSKINQVYRTWVYRGWLAQQSSAAAPRHGPRGRPVPEAALLSRCRCRETFRQLRFWSGAVRQLCSEEKLGAVGSDRQCRLSELALCPLLSVYKPKTSA